LRAGESLDALDAVTLRFCDGKAQACDELVRARAERELRERKALAYTGLQNKIRFSKSCPRASHAHDTKHSA